MKQLLSLLLILSTVLCSAAATEFPHLKFRYYTADDGLSVNTVVSIAQDSDGFMWFATTEGINRFDSKSFKKYLPKSPVDSTVCINNILCVEELWAGKVMAGTRFGIQEYRPETDEFIPFSAKTEDGVGISSPVYDITKGTDNDFWVATFGQGIFHYSVASGTLTQYRKGDGSRLSPASDIVRNVFIDSKERIWILTYDAGFSYYEPVTGRTKSFSPYGGNPAERFDVMCEDRKGRLWLGNYTHGLSLFDEKSGTLTHFLTPESKNPVSHIRCMLEYSAGLLLLASDDGLVWFDTNTSDVKIMKSDYSEYAGINDTYIHSLFIDNERGLWVGTYFGGVNYAPLSVLNFKHFSLDISEYKLPGKIIEAVAEDDKGGLWLGSDDAGVIHYYRGQRRYRQYMPSKYGNSLSYHNIHAILCEKDKVYIGTYSTGLDMLDLKTGRFENFRFGGGESGSMLPSVYALYRDSEDALWLGTPGGCLIFNEKEKSFKEIEETSGADITCILGDSFGYVWIASNNSGIFRYDLETGKCEHFTHSRDCGLRTNMITTVSTDERGGLWFGTDGNGICYWDYYDKKFVFADLPVLETTPVHKMIWNDNYLWVTTNKGLIKFYLPTGDYKIYDTADGIQSTQFCPNSGILSDDGNIYVGGINGLNAFNPNDLKENAAIPKVYISNVKLFNRNVIPGDDTGILGKSARFTDNITLSYDQSVIGFDFVALSYIAPGRNRYAYMLEGLDKDWIYPDSPATVTYTNLPPGNYVFRVKASNNDALWNETGASLKIKVKSPWYASVAAYIVYAVLFCSFLTGAIVMYLRKIKTEHYEKIQRINEKAEREIFESKSLFFTNVIHEIRTPLSLIISPVEHLLKDRLSAEETNEELQMIYRNSQRMLALVNQLLDYRKIEAGNMPMTRTEVDTTSFMSDIFEHYMKAGRKIGLEVSYVVPEDHLYCLTDAEALRKIADNLLSNALKFARARIKCTLDEIRIGGEKCLLLKVEDDGPGIPLSERKNIFKPFYQLKENQPTDGIGTGIGLALLKNLTEQLGGRVEVGTSALGGALFTVMIPHGASPLAATVTETLPEAVAEDMEEIMPEEEEEDVWSLIPSVLVVDDNKDMRKFLMNSLTKHYNATECSDALEALDVLKKGGHFDVIVSDVMMPEMDGFEFCGRIKTDMATSHIPVILLTAKADIASKIEGLETGADIYVEKPFSIDMLLAQIRSLLLNRKRLQDKFASNPVAGNVVLATTKSDSRFLERVDEYIDRNITDTSITAAGIAGYVGISRSALFTKMRAVTGQTPIDYVRLMRLKKAAKLFNKGEMRINEVCYMVGFNSPSYFAKCFAQQFGEIPTAYVRHLQENAENAENAGVNQDNAGTGKNETEENE